MQMRRLGRTGLQVTAIGCGGIPIFRAEKPEAVKVLRHAMDKGITYFDTARGYDKGGSEERLAEAIKGRRDQVIIATKATVRTRDEMAKAIDESLADERARWDREYCRLCYTCKETCAEGVPSRSLMILDLNYRRFGMKRLMSQGMDKQVAAAAACATCVGHECVGYCSYHLPIPDIMTRLHRTYTPIVEAWNAKQAAP